VVVILRKHLRCLAGWEWRRSAAVWALRSDIVSCKLAVGLLDVGGSEEAASWVELAVGYEQRLTEVTNSIPVWWQEPEGWYCLVGSSLE
jgi:hypothetical protein